MFKHLFLRGGFSVREMAETLFPPETPEAQRVTFGPPEVSCSPGHLLTTPLSSETLPAPRSSAPVSPPPPRLLQLQRGPRGGPYTQAPAGWVHGGPLPSTVSSPGLVLTAWCRVALRASYLNLICPSAHQPHCKHAEPPEMLDPG